MRNRNVPASVRAFAWLPLTLASGAAAVYCWQLPARPISLRVSAASGDQLRITWDRVSAPALLARSAVLEIRDGAGIRRLALTSGEVRDGSVTYGRESGDVRVRFTIETGDRWARLRDATATAEFRGAPPEPLRVKPAATVAATLPRAAPEPAGRAPEPAPGGGADREETPHRAAVIPSALPAVYSPAVSLPVPSPPSLAVSSTLATALPGEMLVGRAPAPPRPLYAGPRSGRMIWTGSLARRGVVEIEDSHASVGSLEGALPAVPVTVRVSLAEFAAQGLLVHTSDAAENNRREPASAANGWNSTLFRWEPGRAPELVVLEAPNPTNDYKRLVVRNDARTCSVILVEWSVRPQ